jgi:hypothetical protein
MLGLIRRRAKEALARGEAPDPNPAVAFAVGMIYVFRTSPGARILRELERAVRQYAADPQALWRLVREGGRGDVIDTTKELPPR